MATFTPNFNWGAFAPKKPRAKKGGKKGSGASHGRWAAYVKGGKKR
jgi:hypothetical protein